MRIREQPVIPSAMTLAGFGLTMFGVHRGLNTPSGVIAAGVGRTLDMSDGYVARQLGQTTEFGARLDAGLDKAAVGAAIAHEIQKGIVPDDVALSVGAQNALNALATWQARRRHPDEELKPSMKGKRAMFAQNMALGMFAISATLRREARNKSTSEIRQRWLRRGATFSYHLARGAAMAGNSYGISATRGYFARAGSQKEL